MKNAKDKMIVYAKYYLVPGVWISSVNEAKPTACWATFTPDKKCLGWSKKFLDAKEKVKTHKIELVLQK